MNPDVALHWTQAAIKVSLIVGAPLLGVALVVGLVVSLFQAMTSIQEMTLSSIPKMLAVALVLVLLAPWMLTTLTDFTAEIFRAIVEVSK
jgi:flagellar biosynthetic protein FliQ